MIICIHDNKSMATRQYEIHKQNGKIMPIKPQHLSGRQKELAGLGMTTFRKASVTGHHMLVKLHETINTECDNFTKKCHTGETPLPDRENRMDPLKDTPVILES